MPVQPATFQQLIVGSNGQGSNLQAMQQVFPPPSVHPGYFGGGSVFRSMASHAPGNHFYTPGTVFGSAQTMMPNPMYGSIGMQPGFQSQNNSSQGTQMNLNSVPMFQSLPYDNLTPLEKPTLYKEGGKGVTSTTFSGFDDKKKALSFLQQFDKVYAGGNFTEASKVYQQSIAAAAHLDWPKGKMLIQVLDDSDDIEVQDLIKSEVQKWQQSGMRIVYQHRVVRTGYKAGNLKAAMNCDYVKEYEFVSIFDADFQPQPDFLKRTVMHFKDNDELGLVQARWTFVNKDENLLTRLQDINLCYHFEVEQQVNGVFLNFFGFNGTAGVWRIKALEESGGWLERTTVEDMDIAVRAHLCGWKFIFLNDVKCICELPESFETYRKQQHRWHSGPMQLFRLCLPHIVSSKISKCKKANLIFLFFLLRKLILPFYSFTLFCIILPMTMFIPEAQLPAWVVCYVPALMSFLNIMPAPKSFPFIVPYLLFENTMSVTKFNAMISGLFQLGSAYEWVVTKKVGRASEGDLVGIGQLAEQEQELATEQELLVPKLADPLQPRKKKVNRIYRKELALALLLLTASARSLLSVQGIHFYFLLFQGIAFLVVGLDLIGEQVS
ncbi:hypothetical protein L7F22_008466 [Adiantum nelumboides]|nr:hypothetical protein [Adiantum nelumboides]